jgi:hypothetical protein
MSKNPEGVLINKAVVSDSRGSRARVHRTAVSPSRVLELAKTH